MAADSNSRKLSTKSACNFATASFQIIAKVKPSVTLFKICSTLISHTAVVDKRFIQKERNRAEK